MFCSLYGICGMFARCSGITPASHGGVQLDLSVWPAMGAADFFSSGLSRSRSWRLI